MDLTNERIKLILEIMLNKKYENITENELINIPKIVINSQGLSPDIAENNILFILEKCINLKEITFESTFITKKVLLKLQQSNIINLSLKQCSFEVENDINFPHTMLQFQMNRCFMDDYNFLLKSLPSKLEKLCIDYPSDESIIDISLLESLNNLKVLILDGCIVDFKNMKLNRCEYLSLLRTKVTNDDIISIAQLPNIKKVYISEQFSKLSEIEVLSKKVQLAYNLIEETFDEEESVQKNI